MSLCVCARVCYTYFIYREKKRASSAFQGTLNQLGVPLCISERQGRCSRPYFNKANYWVRIDTAPYALSLGAVTVGSTLLKLHTSEEGRVVSVWQETEALLKQLSKILSSFELWKCCMLLSLQHRYLLSIQIDLKLLRRSMWGKYVTISQLKISIS